ncbi:MAG: transcription antitermination factor NusB [Gemmatimonadetes bacterium GWC2_71_10]|nr:MAG: transcription antitermination factor NusB [Gemmatimonadetes bacterium GWC2_71_10]
MPVRAETRARALALQLLYAREMTAAPEQHARSREDAWSGVLRLSATTPRVQERALALADGVTRRMDELDAHIRRAAEHWRLERLAPIDRHILRLGVLELAGGATPPKVVLDESVRLARWFGGAKSPGFVNGVLDRVARELGRL